MGDKFFAVKIVDTKNLKSKGCHQNVIKQLRREAENMAKVEGHPNILQFEETFGEDNNWMYFVTELVIDGRTKKSVSLDAYMYMDDPRLPKRFPDDAARTIVRQIVFGVKHL